ncbi:hypothetical protein ACMU_10000 [Actibacterium mucosum KCTC 23349]|uniref:Uncharacterized protein n=1 Tax=Actibacterium mucosum KCTC 23349 TaxID=1454373 RepID=A0A037ZMN5_9RHOB|nr:molybdenum ABC transporter ATP-binding protein [Actibacterium mucosum]KAJ56081.1 hypothetical protein ACMU_10000 [Actibacterium mucosum KCTC 23349]
MGALSFDLLLSRGDFHLKAAFEGAVDGVTALFGPSGAGKSTLLRAIAGLEAAEGPVRFDGALWQGAGQKALPAHKRPVGFVFQNAALFAHLDVAGNLQYAARRAAPRAGPDVAEVVAALELAPLMPRAVGGLSGGERQRVALARALLTRPALMLMDEPLSGLDMKRKAAILPLIAEVPRRFGVPVLYVTHAIDEVTRIADRLIALRDGQIAGSGPMAEMVAQLDLGLGGSRFEAGVVLRATVTGTDAGYQLTRLDLDGQTLVMPAAPVEAGAEVQLRVRARDVMVATVRPEGLSAQNILTATIERIEPEESRAFAEVFLRVAEQPLRARLTRAAVDQLALAPGREVFAVLKAISFDRRVL